MEHPQLPTTPPKNSADLIQRARLLAGYRLGELAEWAEQSLPVDLSHNKGLIGQLLERWLGACAGNRALPDFTGLGIELKTLPIGSDEKPLQSTYVSKVPLCDIEHCTWRGSSVYAKLRHVMWVAIQAERTCPLADRVVGQAFLWQPSDEEEALLRADWEFHLARIRAGDVDTICGHDGAVLQIRPKASNNLSSTTADLPNQGTMITKPRGFYLRPAFTHYLIQRYFYRRHADSLAGLGDLLRNTSCS